MTLKEKIEQGVTFVKKHLGGQEPILSIICGSGWANSVGSINIIEKIPFENIPCISNAAVEGHKSFLIIGEGKHGLILIFLGRKHFYEGEGWEGIISPVLLTHELKCKNLLLTNAAGGINEKLETGDIMIIEDHINMIGGNPLIGSTIHEDIPRFPDQTNVYDLNFRRAMEEISQDCEIETKLGVYLGLSGPTFETPAEIRAFASLGADAVGMSTIPEAITANALQMNVGALSLISNKAAGISSSKLSHEEVSDTAEIAMPKMTKLISAISNSQEFI